MANVNDLQKKMASLLDQTSTVPTAGGDAWNLRLEYLNIAQRDWVESYGWPTLYKEINTLTSQSTGLVTISMPSDFRKIDGFLTIATSNNIVHEYPQILPEERSQYLSTDRYFYLLGDPSGYSMVVNPGIHGSGVSVAYSYWSNGATLASPTDQTMCPDPNFLMYQASYYYWAAIDDGRFQVAKFEAEKILVRMLEYETVRGVSYSDRIKTQEELKGFRIGRN